MNPYVLHIISASLNGQRTTFSFSLPHYVIWVKHKTRPPRAGEEGFEFGSSHSPGNCKPI